MVGEFSLAAAVTVLPILASPNLFEPLLERWAFDQFHDQIVRPDIVERTNIRMVQGSYDFRFSLETFAEAIRGNLDCHLAIQPGIAGAIHLAHAPSADATHHFVRPKALTWRKGWQVQ